jgi:hypothetical protein
MVSAFSAFFVKRAESDLFPDFSAPPYPPSIYPGLGNRFPNSIASFAMPLQYAALTGASIWTGACCN